MNVFVISARRSGTHLLTDLIVNNFNYNRIDNSIDYDFLTNENINKFVDTMNSGNKLAWSHYHDYDNFFNKNLNPEHIRELKQIFKNSKIIFVYRDIRDVVTSYFHRSYIHNKFKSFRDFYENCDMNDYIELSNNVEKHDNLIDILSSQYQNWFSVYFAKELLELDMDVISYEEIITDYNDVVLKLSKFLNNPISSDVKDVRIKSITDEKLDIKYSHNEFRRGCIGDWIDTFGKDWGDEVKLNYDNIIGNHVKCYIHNPKIHEYHTPEIGNFQITSKDWKSLEINADAELMQYANYFNTDINFEHLIDSRYDICERLTDDVRYRHKVFFYNDIVLKFIYPCKANLDINTFNYVMPVASKLNLLTIYKTDKILQDLNIAPKLYYAGIHKNIPFVIQERLPHDSIISNMFNIHHGFDWIVNNDLLEPILEQFFSAIKYNILITDHTSPYNMALNDNKLLYLDLDGMQIFDSQSDLILSKKYQNLIKLYTELDAIRYKKFGNKLLKNYL